MPDLEEIKECKREGRRRNVDVGDGSIPAHHRTRISEYRSGYAHTRAPDSSAIGKDRECQMNQKREVNQRRGRVLPVNKSVQKKQFDALRDIPVNFGPDPPESLAAVILRNSAQILR